MKLKYKLLSAFAISFLSFQCIARDKIILPAAITPGPDFEAPIADNERDFVEDVLEDNLKEMAWLKAGMEKGTNANLKMRSAVMLDELQKMDSDFRKYASKKNLVLTDISGTGDVNFLNVKRRKGPAWDREWSSEMVKTHRHVIQRFDDSKGYVTDDDLKNLVDNTLPTLRAQLETLIKLKAELGES